MRKRVSEMTKTKRVPIEVAKKALVVQETVDDTMYVSMPYTYAEAAGRTPKYSAALPRVQAEIAGASATGMMDTGSQINLMTEEFWMKTGLPINESKKIKMQGVNLTGDQSIGLCEFVEVPFAGVTTLAHFHVFRKAPYPFILGQPWIQDHLIATTETGNTFKVLIRDFKDARNRVTMVLRNEPTAAVRGDAPTVIEYAPNPVETSAYFGTIEDDDLTVDPLAFANIEKGLARAYKQDVVTIEAGPKDARSTLTTHASAKRFGRQL
ncbi:hypothetical protein M408DRAFT_31093 [Serendipita vermifera MAFF 305830]|uniref:Peptidase A2 domain-containing protein n=1 Tax=Serendipita vermifera MAFF 305830 TaxID=933852 RepID=A0A0C2WPQ0_SERVB|nr:hypothetical protein M408DRAFT_31093 [Serendipita vermifera MAFF 305830]